MRLLHVADVHFDRTSRWEETLRLTQEIVEIAEGEALARPAGGEETGAIASELLRDVLRGLGERLAAHDGPRVLLAHAMVDGSRTSAGQPLVGLELSISL